MENKTKKLLNTLFALLLAFYPPQQDQSFLNLASNQITIRYNFQTLMPALGFPNQQITGQTQLLDKPLQVFFHLPTIAFGPGFSTFTQ